MQQTDKMGASEFKAKCLRILDNVPAQGLILTKRGRPVARLLPFRQGANMADFIGVMAGRIEMADDESAAADWQPEDELLFDP